MHKKILYFLIPAVYGGLLVTQFVSAQSGGSAMSLHADLRGYSEVPAVSSKGSGEFRATVSTDEKEIAYELEYSGLEGTPTMSHIHFGQPLVNGSIMIWLCTTTAAPITAPAGTPTCPSNPGGKVSGKITAASIVPIPTQGIAANELAEALAAMRSRNAYANVHTSMSPAGEIRGQIKPGRGVGDDDDDDDDNGKWKGKGKGKGKDGDDDSAG